MAVVRHVVSYASRVEDVNIAGHLDNLAILRAVDEARNEFLGMPRLPGLPGIFDGFGAGVAPFVVAHRAEYRQELHHVPGAPLEVSLWVCRLGSTSLDVAAQVCQAPGAPVALVSTTTVVLMTFAAVSADQPPTAPRPWPVDEPARSALAAYLHEPPIFR